MVRDMRNGALARELLPSAKPSSAPLKLLFRLIAEEHVEACLFLGRAVWFVRTHLPGVYGRLAGV